MRVTVRLSKGLADRVGRARLEVELPDGATVGDLVRHLAGQLPAAPFVAQALAVVDGRHALPEEPLAGGQEVALLLPAAGG